jgi:hypothetical protein
MLYKPAIAGAWVLTLKEFQTTDYGQRIMSNYTIQNIFKSYENYLASTPQPLKNRKAIHAITHCRTEVMGTSYFSCPEGHQPIKQHLLWLNEVVHLDGIK